MSKPTLFLDVDGVLNRCGKSGQGLETEKVDLLRQIINACDPDIVVSSTWRFIPHQCKRLQEVVASIGGRIVGATPVGEKTEGVSRGQEIQHWMDENKTPSRYVILDDDSDMEHLSSHLVKTDSYVGLTEEIAARVIALLK